MPEVVEMAISTFQGRYNLPKKDSLFEESMLSEELITCQFEK